jgi:hypothetical protein
MGFPSKVWMAVAVFAVILGAAQFIRPVPTNPPWQPLLAGSEVHPAVYGMLERACQDCHSSNTQWPWYARVAPVSWLVLDDVEKGREFLDLTRWAQYSKGQRLGYLAAMASATKSKRMPPEGYTFLHPEARLTDEERVALADWARAEHKRIRTQKKPESLQSSTRAQNVTATD